MARGHMAGWSWMMLGWQSAALALEAQEVIALRLAMLAAGGPKAQSEAVRMVSEKMLAATESQMLMLRALGRNRVERGARSVVGLYRRRVKANRRRLRKS